MRLRIDALLDQAGDAEHQRARLAAAGAGDDQHRPLGGRRGLELGGVEQPVVVDAEAGFARRAAQDVGIGWDAHRDGRRVASAVATRYGLYQLFAPGGQWQTKKSRRRRTNLDLRGVACPLSWAKAG